MADDLLRAAERRYRELGTPAEEVALLQARLRAGLATFAGVELAAHLLDPAAIEVLEGAPAASGELRRRRLRIECDLRGWARALGRWGHEPCVRAALAVGHLVHGPEPRTAASADVTLLRDAVSDADLVEAEAVALEAAEAWLACPCAAHSVSGAAAARRVEASRDEHPLSRWRRALVAAGAATVASGPAAQAGDVLAGFVAIAGLVWSPQAASEALIHALRPWALGEGS